MRPRPSGKAFTSACTTGRRSCAPETSPRCSRRWPGPRACRPGRSVTPDGERRLTDLRHIGQLLHVAASEEQLGITALTAWLRRRMLDAGADTSDEDRSRRLESDAEAVQVLTIHRSKGLEFPVVYLPFLWESELHTQGRAGHLPRPGHALGTVGSTSASTASSTSVTVTSTSSSNAARTCAWPTWRSRAPVTRSCSGGPGRGTAAIPRSAGSCSPAGPDGTVPAVGSATPTDAAAAEAFTSLAAQAPGCVSVERAEPGLPVAWSPPSGPARISRRPASRAASIGAGAGRPTATSPPAPTMPRWPASPRSRRWRRARYPARAAAVEAPGRRGARGRGALAARGPAGRGSRPGRSSTRSSRPPTSPPAISRATASRARDRAGPARRGAGGRPGGGIGLAGGHRDAPRSAARRACACAT